MFCTMAEFESFGRDQLESRIILFASNIESEFSAKWVANKPKIAILRDVFCRNPSQRNPQREECAPYGHASFKKSVPKKKSQCQFGDERCEQADRNQAPQCCMTNRTAFAQLYIGDDRSVDFK